MSMESPEFIRITGKGEFLFGDSTVESTFVLSRNPYWIGIVGDEKSLCEAAFDFNLKLTSDFIQLSGILNDGRPVKIDSLRCSYVQCGSHPGVEFTALEGVSIGQEKDIPPDESRYHLTGYFDGEFAIVHDDWDIKTIPCQSPKNLQAFAMKWRYPVEGMVLKLRREGSTIDQHRKFAIDVMTMLSLASGTGVSCDRYILIWDKEELEYWRHMTGAEIGPGPIVPGFEVGGFLEQTLPVWQTLSQTQRKVLHLAISDINQSESGYLDTRLFHIFQPWEYLAEAWGMHGELSDSVICLRSQLQKARKQWNKEHPDSDPHGFWGSRITAVFGWPNLRDAIDRLAALFGLDLERVGLDLNLLKKARDSVAHSGKLSDDLTGPDLQALDLLTMAQYCLQLLLLRMLKYHGRVYHAKGGWRTIADINKALTTARILRQH